MNWQELALNMIAALAAGLSVAVIALVFQNAITKNLQKGSKTVEAKIRDAAGELLDQVYQIESPKEATISEEGQAHSPASTKNKEVEFERLFRLVVNYHEQALAQTSIQFWFSIAAAIVGFLWILYAGLKMDEHLATAAKVLPGTVIGAVATLFMKQSYQTRQRATDLFDWLRKDKRLLDSKQLMPSIEDVRLRSAVKALVVLHMAGLEESVLDLEKFFVRQKDGHPDSDSLLQE